MPTILITGASSGIGKTCAKYFAQRGWQVAATMRRPELETELNKLSNVRLFRLDVLDLSSIETAIAQTLEAFGSIEVLLNNAGFAAIGPFEAAEQADWEKEFNTNLFGLMRVTKAILPYFRAKKSGTILNLTSMGGHFSLPWGSLYHSSKWAVEGFSESLRYELEPLNIRVKTIQPGAIKTDFYNRSLHLLETKNLKNPQDYDLRKMDFWQQAGDRGENPEVVAKAVFEAASDQSFRLRFATGLQAKAILFLRKILPDRFFFHLVKKMISRSGS